MLDFLHMPIVVALVTGYLWLPWWIPTASIAAVMVGQMIVRGCPLTNLSMWLRRRVDPGLPARTLWLAGKYEARGRLRVLLVGLGYLAAVSIIAAFVQHVI